jgi:hypothetical protein
MELIRGVWVFAEQEDGHLHDVGLKGEDTGK